MIQAIVFDFDGIIVDSEPLHYRAFLELLAPLGVSFDYDKYMRDYIGFDDRDALRSFSAEYGFELSDERMSEMVAEKATAFERIVAEGIEAFPGVVELVESSAAAMPIAICSGALRSDIDAILPAIGDGDLASRFNAMVTADNVSRSKPDPESYALAAQRLGTPPAHCLAIEDTPTGLESARNAGLRTLAVANTCSVTELRQQADRVVDSLLGIDVDQLRKWFA